MRIPSPSPIARLAGAAFAAHAGDQLAFAAIPIAAVAAGAGPGLVGLLVGVQSAAWLLVSLPAGAWADRIDAGRLIARALAVAAIGLAIAALAGPDPTVLALGGFSAAAAAAAVSVAAVAAVPHLAPGRTAWANARVELARATAGLLAPLLAGMFAVLGPALVFGSAALLALAVLPAVRRLVMPAAGAPARPSARRAILAGAAAVSADPRLRAIALCAVCWNFGFFALAGIFVPLAAARGIAPQAVGTLLAAYGAGLILGALAAPRVLAAVPPGAVLVFGPASSLIGAAAIVVPADPLAMAAGQFLLGFGPMLWLVARTGLLQSATDPGSRGSVAAVMQVSVFGVRPLGALAAAALAAAAGIEAAAALALAAFAASLVAILASPVRALRTAPAVQ